MILYSSFIIVISHRYPPLRDTYINELLPNAYNGPNDGIYSSSTIVAITSYLCGSTMDILLTLDAATCPLDSSINPLL